jgi:hypothetical protein
MPMKIRNEPEWKLRYRQAYKLFYNREYPLAVKDHGIPEVKFPKVKTSNGLQRMIINFLNWSGHRATRINVQGKLVHGAEKQASGTVLVVKKFVSSTTRKGTADISSTIRGRSAMFEIKIGRDKPSEFQMKEQERERRAGGIYEFIGTPEDFFELFDRILEGRV